MTDDFARHVMHANGITPSATKSVGKLVIAALRVSVLREIVTKTGAARGARWFDFVLSVVAKKSVF